MESLYKVILSVVLVFYFSISKGQSTYDKETFDDAEYFFMQEDYQESIISYLRLYKRGFKDNANINYRIGICYLYSNTDREKAVPYLEFAITKISSKYKEGELKEVNAPVDAYLYLGNAYRINMQHDKAIEAYNKYIELTATFKDIDVDRKWALSQIEACKRAKIATNNLIRVKYTPLGKPINTKDANYSPAISENEEYIAYVSKQRFYSAVMFDKKKKGKWDVPRNITPEIMSDGDQVPVFLSADGKTLLLAKFDFENSDIYISTSNGKEWTPSVPLNKDVNSKFWESHACMTSDGKTIYFTSNRPQSLGGTDIFVSHLQPDGKWSTATNLGSNINTDLNEETPFLSEKDSVLYFSSQGHESIGGYDIYYSTLDANGNWSQPKNMGYPVNTTDDDLFFAPTANKYFAYQAKAFKGGLGDLDIVKVETFSEEHPYKFSIKGNLVSLLKNEKSEKYNVSLLDYATKNELEKIKPSANGDFVFEKVAGTYLVKFSSDSFTVKGNYFIIPENYPSDTYFLTPEILGISDAYAEYLASKKSGKKLTSLAKTYTKDQRPALIHNILFSFAESKLTKAAENELDTIAKLMLEFPSLKVEIVGHTDAQGAEPFNQSLSEKRAASVKSRLLERGVSSNRVIESGKGETMPIAINENADGSDNPIGRAFNRRVEFTIVESDNKNIIVDIIRVPEELKVLPKQAK